MTAVVCIAVAIGGFFLLAKLGSGSSSSAPGGSLSSSTQTRDYDWLLQSGVPARGILLEVAPTGAMLSMSSRSNLRLEQRRLLLDIEIPGKPPYQLQASPFVPFHLVPDILPGATVELRVDPQDRTQVMVYGPGVGLPLAPYAGGGAAPALPPAPASAQRLVAAPAPVPSLGAPIAIGAGMQKCGSCGAIVNAADVRRHNNRCTTCGASWN